MRISAIQCAAPWHATCGDGPRRARLGMARFVPPRAIFVAVTLALSVACWATDPLLRPQDRSTAFSRLDTDHDGWISRDEASAHPEIAANFEKADHDHDGRISFAEFEKIPLNRTDQPGRFRNANMG